MLYVSPDYDTFAAAVICTAIYHNKRANPCREALRKIQGVRTGVFLVLKAMKVHCWD